MRRAGPRGAARASVCLTAGLAACLTAAAACVRVDSGPNGVASARRGDVPPSIVQGDVLRDSAGVATLLQAFAFDESGNPLPTAQLRYTHVPTLRDSAGRLVGDSALVVDSTGRVRATLPPVLQQAVIAIRVGDRLQLLDTLEIVRRPDSAAVTVVADTLRYDCTDDRLTFNPRTGADTLFNNASSAFGLTVLSDTVGSTPTERLPVRARLVRWSVVSPAVPVTRLPGGTAADTVPALLVADDTTGARQQPLDTTDTQGRSNVRLRIRPTGLGRTVLPNAVNVVQVRGVVQPGATPVRGGSVTFFIPIKRQAASQASANAACQ